jgi:hypothetical protein
VGPDISCITAGLRLLLLLRRRRRRLLLLRPLLWV